MKHISEIIEEEFEAILFAERSRHDQSLERELEWEDYLRRHPFKNWDAFLHEADHDQ